MKSPLYTTASACLHMQFILGFFTQKNIDGKSVNVAEKLHQCHKFVCHDLYMLSRYEYKKQFPSCTVIARCVHAVGKKSLSMVSCDECTFEDVINLVQKTAGTALSLFFIWCASFDVRTCTDGLVKNLFLKTCYSYQIERSFCLPDPLFYCTGIQVTVFCTLT